MTARQAEELAQKLWGSDTRIGRVHRGRSRKPLFKVGYANVNGAGAWLGGSNVDWESAFAIAAQHCNALFHSWHCTKDPGHRGRHHEVRAGAVVAEW